LGDAQPNSVALRLLSEPAARTCRQLECLHNCMTWRNGPLCVVTGELERQGSATFVWAPDPTLRPPCVGPTLLEDGNYLCERVVRGGDSSCEQVVRGEAESPRARKRILVRSGGSSCGTKTCLARRRLLVQGGSLSRKSPTGRRWGGFVSEALDEDLHPSLSWILTLTLSMV
jgi:hypothetical protein